MVTPPSFAPVQALVDGQSLHLETDPAARWAMLMDLIRDAQTSLRLFFYIFANDQTGKAVVEALVDAASRGVKIWLMVDGFGSNRTPEQFFAPLVAAGGMFARFNPHFGMRYLLRNHQKMVIADDRVAIIGGANIQSSYFGEGRGRPWHDLMLRVEGTSVRRLALYFDGLRRWVMGDKHKLRALLHLLSRRSDRYGTVRWLHNGPFRRLGPLAVALKKDLEIGKNVHMVQAYFSPNWGVLRRLGRIVSRGGRMALITAAVSDNSVTVAAARHCYKGLLRRGAHLYEFGLTMLHTKLVVVDDVVYVGSANFDMRSLFINAEVMLRIEDRGFAMSVRRLFADHVSASIEITPEIHERRSSFLARLRWFLSYYLVATIDFTVTRRFSLPRQIVRIRQTLPGGDGKNQSP